MPFTKEKRGHTFFMMVFFVCLGITTEVFFTAFSALLSGETVQNKPTLALAGYSYVWMALVYGTIPLFGHYFYPKASQIPVYYRYPLYVAIIYAVEFTSGYILRATTGACPWEYTTGWHIMGLVRLDYFPAWLVFVAMVERLYVFINRRVIQ